MFILNLNIKYNKYRMYYCCNKSKDAFKAVFYSFVNYKSIQLVFANEIGSIGHVHCYKKDKGLFNTCKKLLRQNFLDSFFILMQTINIFSHNKRFCLFVYIDMICYTFYTFHLFVYFYTSKFQIKKEYNKESFILNCKLFFS